MKIYAQNGGTLTKQERLDIATLLLKAGYVVSVKKVKIDGKPTDVVEYSAKQQAAVEAEKQEEPGS